MMHFFQYEIMLIALCACIACAIPGLLLVLNGTALLSDAISHSILPGIVITFLCINSLESPLLLVGAGIAGMITVLVTQYIIRTRRVKKDAAIGLVFPFFFSLGVLLVTLHAKHTHLDTDMVILGELAFAPFQRIVIAGYDIGAYNLWTVMGIALINITLLFVFLKEFIFGIFDPIQARLFALKPQIFFYLMMCMTSLTCVTAFESIGSLVVVALMITPAACALLVASRLHEVIFTSIFCAVLSALNGYCIANLLNVSIAGSIAMSSGILFLYCWLFAPHKGYLSDYLAQRRMNNSLDMRLLAELLADKNQTLANLQAITSWSEKRTRTATQRLILQNFAQFKNDMLELTPQGLQNLIHRVSQTN